MAGSGAKSVGLLVRSGSLQLKRLVPTLLSQLTGDCLVGRGGEGVFGKGRKLVYGWRTAKHGRTRSFRAESKAFEDALPWMAANTSQDNCVIVVTRLPDPYFKTGFVHFFPPKIQGLFKAFQGYIFPFFKDSKRGKIKPI